VATLKAEAPYTEFSYDTIGRDLQAMLAADSRRALLITSLGIVAIVIAGFRSVRLGALVLMPIAYAAVVTVGILTLAGHRFTGMALSALPLVIGIGIDNGIHFVRRHLEPAGRDVPALVADIGAPLIQTNLTTMIGFGALMTSTFGPLAEMGLLTAVGVGITLLGSLLVLPALLSLPRVRTWLPGSRSGDAVS
jgi:predicted RND superfamily exporter protein